MRMVCATAEAFEYSECAVLTRWGAYHFAPPIWKNLNKHSLTTEQSGLRNFTSANRLAHAKSWSFIMWQHIMGVHKGKFFQIQIQITEKLNEATWKALIKITFALLKHIPMGTDALFCAMKTIMHILIPMMFHKGVTKCVWSSPWIFLVNFPSSTRKNTVSVSFCIHACSSKTF
jgi:hypothetical protein